MLVELVVQPHCLLDCAMKYIYTVFHKHLLEGYSTVKPSFQFAADNPKLSLFPNMQDFYTARNQIQISVCCQYILLKF